VATENSASLLAQLREIHLPEAPVAPSLAPVIVALILVAAALFVVLLKRAKKKPSWSDEALVELDNIADAKAPDSVLQTAALLKRIVLTHKTSVSHQTGAALNAHTLKFVLLALAWVSLLTAIAQPYLPKATTAQPASGRALSMLVDLSTSMERKDFQIDDEAVDRLTVVKGIASRFIENRSGDRLGLVLFGTEAFIASPLTYDLNAVATTLQSSGIGMAGRTTAMGDALGLAIKSLRDDPAQEKAIVLLSDGTNNAGTAEPEDAAKLARSFGITIYTIGLGSDDATDSQQQFQSASADSRKSILK